MKKEAIRCNSIAVSLNEWKRWDSPLESDFVGISLIPVVGIIEKIV